MSFMKKKCRKCTTDTFRLEHECPWRIAVMPLEWVPTVHHIMPIEV